MGKGNDIVVGSGSKHRRRISNWTSQELFLNGTMQQPQQPFFKANPSLKSSVWVKDASGNTIRCIDDFSLLVTISDNNQRNADGTPVMKPGWDDRFLSGRPERKDFFQQIIKFCHETLGVQCLIGWENKDAHGTAFEDWITGAQISIDKRTKARSVTGFTGVPKPSVDEVAQSIVDFMDANVPDADGISFDIEGLGGLRPSAALEKIRSTVRQNLTDFIQALARRLHSPKLVQGGGGTDPGFDRIVAVTAAGLIGHVGDASGSKDGKLKKSRWLKHEGGPTTPLVRGSDNRFVTDQNLASADFAFEVWDYDSAKSTNILIRPMCYDNSSVNAANRLADWHADINQYVTVELNMHPGNFQMGIKTAPGNAVITSPSVVADRCRNLLAPHDHGIIFFPQSSSFWKTTNEALNPSVPEAGKHAGEPLQCPLNAKALKRLRQTPP